MMDLPLVLLGLALADIGYGAWSWEGDRGEHRAWPGVMMVAGAGLAVLVCLVWPEVGASVGELVRRPVS